RFPNGREGINAEEDGKSGKTGVSGKSAIHEKMAHWLYPFFTGTQALWSDHNSYFKLRLHGAAGRSPILS
ncbi:MAG TPA: hypothetical protein VLS90_02395, partial [Thermodesulfobacteriota bacterium]|nr:hypothetical protein [Thermodesulfobacteriota bacterium]